MNPKDPTDPTDPEDLTDITNPTKCAEYQELKAKINAQARAFAAEIGNPRGEMLFEQLVFLLPFIHDRFKKIKRTFNAKQVSEIREWTDSILLNMYLPIVDGQEPEYCRHFYNTIDKYMNELQKTTGEKLLH